ncbi:MAG: hypothetical protein F8N39_17095 [Clostridiaceae bacterium]|nr:hypothetical protein [Clostridiaceae bacterium]
MTNIIPFEFDGASVRVMDVDGEPWFVGKDVAERLGYVDPTNAMKQHCRGVVKRHPIVDTLGRTQEARILSESDVLRLIVGSKLPAAERFERWVFEEVLPSIRKTGGYMVAAPEETPEQLAIRALAVLQATVERQKAQLASAMPKAEVYDRIANADGLFNMTRAAKLLHQPPHAFIRRLHAEAWIYKRAGSDRWTAYQDKIFRGYLEHKTTTVPRSDGTEKVVDQVVVTPKGITKLAALFGVEPDEDLFGDDLRRRCI